MYDKLNNPLYDSNDEPLYEICPCCGFQSGYDDMPVFSSQGLNENGSKKLIIKYPHRKEALKLFKDRWISSGCKWFSKSKKPPENWNSKVQLALVENKELKDKKRNF
jgi:hypothetical protein